MTIDGETFKVKEPSKNTNVNCVQKWQKWDRTLASIFGLLAFFTIVSFVIYRLTTSEPVVITTTMGKQEIGFSGSSPKCTKTHTCTITCSKVDEAVDGSIGNLINEVLPSVSCYPFKLRISASTFHNSKLSEGWLENIDANVSFVELVKCIGNDISERAFSGYPFEVLDTLYIVESGLTTLKKNSFLGLKFLKTFEFRNDNRRPLTVEKEFFEVMPLLQIISYSEVILDKVSLSNSFGCDGASLSSLKSLALSNNNIEEIDECTFSKVDRVQSLYLANSRLKRIRKNTLKGKNQLKELQLQSNDFITLEEGVFDNLEFKSRGLSLYDNNWLCNCSLQWLQDYYFGTAYVNIEKPPKCNNSLGFEEVDFCVEDPTSTTHTTTKSTTPPATTTTSLPTQEPEYVTINCSLHNSSEERLIVVTATVVHSVSVKIKEEFVDLDFQEFDDGDGLKVKVVTDATLELHHLVWFNSNNKSECGCDSPLENGLILDRLNRNTTYTFSVLENDKSEVSPKSTFGIKTEPDWKDRIWISNKQQTLVISSTVLSGLLFILLTAFATYLCIRRNPKIISGNKSVIIVKPKKDIEVSHYPKEYEKPPYWDPYLVATSQGYLTPKLHRYSKVRYRPPLTRSMSEYSMGNASTMYADPKQTYDLKLLHSRMRAKLESDDFTPPLPPPNLKFQQRHSEFDEDELYSSI